MALRKVCIDPFNNSTKGFLTGYFRLPHSTECSRICAIPVESSGGVLKVMPNTLFSSSLTRLSTSAPVFLCRNSCAWLFTSAICASRLSSKAGWDMRLLGRIIVVGHNVGT
ncbi:hypothetical protein D3C72_1770660 [compost metagenome]